MLQFHIKKPPSVNCVTIKKTNDSRKPTTVRLGKNTDTTGFDKALYSSGLSDFFYTHKNCCAIVLGYGGAAKAAIQALLLDSNFKRIIVFNRTFSKLNNIKEKNKIRELKEKKRKRKKSKEKKR